MTTTITNIYYYIINTYSTLLTSFAYNCIFYFSKGQILVNKFTRKIKEIPIVSSFITLFQSNSKTNHKSLIDYKYEYIKIQDNNIIITEENNLETNDDYDFLICKKTQENKETNHNNNNIQCVNYKLFHYNDNHTNCIDINHFEPSEIKFMLLECCFNGNVYKIELKTDKLNFYLVNNKLNKLFFIYYIKQHLRKNDDINVNDNCSIILFDHNVNVLKIDLTNNDEYILLEKDGYIIHQL
jgi:hypothetical protein